MSPAAVVKHTPPQGGHDVGDTGGAVVGGGVVVVAGEVVVSGGGLILVSEGRVVPGGVVTQSPLQGSVGVQVA